MTTARVLIGAAGETKEPHGGRSSCPVVSTRRSPMWIRLTSHASLIPVARPPESEWREYCTRLSVCIASHSQWANCAELS